MTASRYSNCITELATEMPRCFSISIQSEVAWRPLLRAFTVPAIWIAPREQQQLFGQRGLARVRVGNDGERAAAGHFAGGVRARQGIGHGGGCHAGVGEQRGVLFMEARSSELSRLPLNDKGLDLV